MTSLDYTVKNIPRYPEDGNHVELHFEAPEGVIIPFNISKGYDLFFWKNKKGKEVRSNPKKWITARTKNCIEMETKMFETQEKAVEYAFKMYSIYLKKVIDINTKMYNLINQ